jgi:Uma2 family endonuclease
LVPPLQNGDYLDAAEFWRRYEASPENLRAELIEGRVFMMMPAHEDHAGPHIGVAGWLSLYAARTRGTKAYDNITLQLRGDNTVQPDATLVVAAEAGGRSLINERRILEGAPELVCEVAASSASHDLFDKKKIYHANRVLEYIVWQTLDHRLDWFCWGSRDYVRISPDSKGLIRSANFPGLWLDVPALLARRYDAVFDALEAGLKTAEHAEFIARLGAKLKSKRKH